MTISELIRALEVVQATEGDVPVVVRASIMERDRSTSFELSIESVMDITDCTGARVAIDAEDLCW